MDAREELDALKGDKERMIRQYLALQDKADAVNGEIYKVCCDIKALEDRIAQVEGRVRKSFRAVDNKTGRAPRGTPPQYG